MGLNKIIGSNKRIGKCLRLYSLFYEIDIRELSRQIGIPKSTIFDIISGYRKTISEEPMIKIIEWLIREDDHVDKTG